MEQAVHTAVNWLSREQVVQLLEGNGMACYDTEQTDDLRAALIECISDGDIAFEDLPEVEK